MVDVIVKAYSTYFSEKYQNIFTNINISECIKKLLQIKSMSIKELS